ncbi:X-ray repair cross-complementing protein 5-like [Trichogramma pretiosum]|uniref:X-ray repair cross-complementing protein 5-like n=1 Tax=Trichogramma pretiosum TaxID=7493 RepID=UPI000C719DD2|nr:X-ray repair cross-complementing protein 5-like [Trichogramma pretiosum]XP_023318254.1 X-ray repair cross-complementing protein 5-like [Trichogramma pretiosum]
MPPKKQKSYIILVANVGCSSSEKIPGDNESFLDKAKFTMKMLIQKKIFLEPNDEFGIITMGEDVTENPDQLPNIKLYQENSRVPDWEMVNYINNLQSKPYDCNWIEALFVSLGFIQKNISDPDAKCILIIFNNFKEKDESIEPYDIEAIESQLLEFEQLHVILVGDNPLNDNVNYDDLKSASEKMAKTMTMQCAAVQYEEINDMKEGRQFFTPPQSHPATYKFPLEWDEIVISCASYIKITESKKLETWKMHALVENIAEEPKKEYLHKEVTISDKSRNQVESVELTKAYKFGQKYIPVSDEDEMQMAFKGTEKGMKIYGFALQKDVKLEYWTGIGTRIIVPETEDDAKAFYSLVKAMVEMNYVAIVRKVYQNDNAPKMGVLFPKTEPDSVWCLVHLELPFGHDTRAVESNYIKNEANSEKIKAMDQFIDSMTITEQEPAYLREGIFPNVHKQYHWNTIAARALKADDAFSMDEYIKKVLEPPARLKNQFLEIVDNMESVFPNCGKIKKKSDNPDQRKDKEMEVQQQQQQQQQKVDVMKEEVMFSAADIELKAEDFDEF